jgi:glycosyltransferase involved in cell wall biosynthesis
MLIVGDAALISVIVTTFNREDALDAALRALSAQSDKNFEIIIADDGSRPETRTLIDGWRTRLPVPLKHVRHEHRGFRGGEIRNRGIVASEGALCVFLDGDCLAAADFVAEHRRLAEPGWFVTGHRILLSRELTHAVLAQGEAAEQWCYATLTQERLRGGINRLIPTFRLPLGPLRKLSAGSWRGAQTCNLAVARSDLDRIDGFDCSYAGWGLEDSDLVVRLLHAGVRRKDGRFATGVLHLWHPPNDRAQLSANRRRLDDVMSGSRTRALRGMSALSATDDAPAMQTSAVAQ